MHSKLLTNAQARPAKAAPSVDLRWMNLMRMFVEWSVIITTYESCPKSIRLYFFPEKPVAAGWQI
jgi:hypothetical protein